MRFPRPFGRSLGTSGRQLVQQMIPANPNSVYITNSEAAAELLAVWLQQNGIAAQLISNVSLGGVPEMIMWSAAETISGAFEVRVGNDEVEAAKMLVQRFEAERTAITEERRRRGDVTARCEACGLETCMAGQQRGTVMRCSGCNAWMDVPE